MVIGPTFLWILIEIPFLEINSNFMFSKLVCLLVMIVFIPAFYYLYSNIFKKSIFILNIIEFIIAIALGQASSYVIYNYLSVPPIIGYFSILILSIIMYLYLKFTYNPPKNFLFEDLINKKYGIDAHMDLGKKE